ncbi:MAG: InlB B-repeat-containing protein [Clostridium sp.]
MNHKYIVVERRIWYAFIITTQKPTRKGYVFNGWNTKKDGSGREVCGWFQI